MIRSARCRSTPIASNFLGSQRRLRRNVSPQNARGGFSASDGGLLRTHTGGASFRRRRSSGMRATARPRARSCRATTVPSRALAPASGYLRTAGWWRPRTRQPAGAANRTSLIDVARGTAAPLLAPTSFAIMPVWARDSKTLLLSYSAAGVPGLVRYSTERGGPPELLLASAAAALPTDWSADGRLILFHSVSAETAGDIYALTLPEKKSYPWVKGAASQYQGQLVPGATGPWWMAYVSNESGQPEVYLERFTLEGRRSGRARVSVDGGESPRWRADGRELYQHVRPTPDGGWHRDRLRGRRAQGVVCGTGGSSRQHLPAARIRRERGRTALRLRDGDQ